MSKKISKKSIWEDITLGYVASLRHGEEELGLIIKGHLLIEYILNQIIEQTFKKPEVFFKDNRANSFSVKLNILYSLGLIPMHIYKNIQSVNKIRNQYAHNLKVESDKLTFNYYREDKEVNNKEYFNKKKNPEREYIKILCFGTLTELRNHYSKKYGEQPKFSLEKLF